MNQTDAPVVVPATPNGNSSDLLLERVAQTPDLALFGRQQGDTWVDVTARDYLEQVRALAKGFIAAGIEPGEKIGLMAKTRYEWTLIDFAAWFAGAILVRHRGIESSEHGPGPVRAGAAQPRREPSTGIAAARYR